MLMRLGRWLWRQCAKPPKSCRWCGQRPPVPDMRDCCSEECAVQAQAFTM